MSKTESLSAIIPTSSSLDCLESEIEDGLEFFYIAYNAILQVRDIGKNRAGQLAGSIDIGQTNGDAYLNSHPILDASFNMSSLESQKRLAKQIVDHAKEEDAAPWGDILQDVARRVQLFRRNGADGAIEILPSDEDILTVDYLAKPFLYQKHPSVIFGDYGSLKSYFALILSYLVLMPHCDNLLGVETLKTPTVVGYFDWEDDITSFRKRWSAINRGFKNEYAPLYYLKMKTPLSECISLVRREIRKNNLGLIILDSLGLAAGGDLNSSESAVRFHSALRQLPVTSLTLAHCSKDALTRNRSIFGSVFFSNLARNIWECKALSEPDENEAVISLKQIKASFSQKAGTIGYKFTFNDNSIEVIRTDLRDTELKKELALDTQISGVLLKQGRLSVKEIAEQIERSYETTNTTLGRMKKKSKAVQFPDKTWGLPA